MTLRSSVLGSISVQTLAEESLVFEEEALRSAYFSTLLSFFGTREFKRVVLLRSLFWSKVVSTETNTGSDEIVFLGETLLPKQSWETEVPLDFSDNSSATWLGV